MNFKNFSLLLFQNKTNKLSKQDNKLSKFKHFLQLDKQRTKEVQTQRSLEIVISLQYYKGKPGILFMHCCFGQK